MCSCNFFDLFVQTVEALFNLRLTISKATRQVVPLVLEKSIKQANYYY